MEKAGVRDGDRTRNPRSHRTNTSRCINPRLLRKIDRSLGDGGCWPWIGWRGADGYGKAARFPEGRRRNFQAHRLVMEDVLGRLLLDVECVRHRCDNPPCCNPAHLELGTQLDNVRDREDRARTAHGAAMPWAKLTDDQVRSIVADSRSATAIAASYGVCHRTVLDIKAGRRWNRVTGLPRCRRPIPYAERGEIKRARAGLALVQALGAEAGRVAAGGGR